jgi:lipopolysaccharide export system permease protein
MRQIDRLIMKELVGPWLFGVGLFSSLLMAATYLGRIAGFIVDQVPPALVGQLVMLLFPAILVKTFTMAVLLAALMAFGRLSSDSEIVALRAGGASIFRIVVPVMVFSFLIALVTFWFDEQVVPSATRRSKELQEQIVHNTEIKGNRPMAQTIVRKGKLQLAIVAQNVNPASEALQGVTVIAYDEKEQPSYTLRAREIVFEGLLKGIGQGLESGMGNWRINGEYSLVPADYSTVIRGKDAWPDQVPNLQKSFAELTAPRKDEFDLMSMKELKAEIDKHTAAEDWTKAEISNAEYGLWNKVSVPLAAFVFGTLGAVLGIRNHRTGTAAGFALAIGIIFGYVTLANFMNVWASGGVLPAYVASFAPITLGFIASGIIMWRRNA